MTSSVILTLLCFCVLFIHLSSAGVTKRDLTESTGEEEYCIEDSNCLDILQWCDKTKFKVYGTCSYHTWFWPSVVGAILLLCGSCLASILCCLCNCCCK